MKNTTYNSNTTGEYQKISYLFNQLTNSQVSLSKGNWAFLDMQNICVALKNAGWKINWKLFREFLVKEYNVINAVGFLGYIKENDWKYDHLIDCGFDLQFREVFRLPDGKIDGGNVDADLASYIMDHKNDYDRAVLVAADGDYCRTVLSLIAQDKLKHILSPSTLKNTSRLLKEIAPYSISSIENIKSQIELT